MKTILRNFNFIFRRFVIANVLNLLGLSLSFAAFFVIISQVIYDSGYDKSIKDYQHVYRLTLELGPGMEAYGRTLPRPLGELMAQSSPHIKSMGMDNFQWDWDLKVGESEYSVQVYQGINDFVSVYEPEMLFGTTTSLNEPGHLLIPESLARRFFGTTDAVGKMLTMPSVKQDYVVGGVFKDYPENSSLHDCLFYGSDENKDNNNNWNYRVFLRLDNPANVSIVEEAIRAKVRDYFKDSSDMDELKAMNPSLTNVADAHFSKQLDKSAPSKSSLYLLICFSFLIIVIAIVNFMNFTLAETPMRIRSINTQKVLGATAAKLRGSLLIETVFISLLAFGLSLIWIVIARDLGLQELVQASIKLGDKPMLMIGTFAVSVIAGLLAGAYPSYYVTSFPPALVLKGSFGLSPKGRMLRTTLVCLQFIISFVLIVGVGIMYLQSHYIFSSDYGFDKDRILVANVSPETRSSQDAVINELKGITGVEGVSFSMQVIGSSDTYMSWGRGEGEKYMTFTCFPVDYHYLDVMGIKIVEGRDYKAGDGDLYLFTESAKKKYPFLRVGEKINADDYEVVGFCEDLMYTSFRDDDNLPLAFFISSADGNYKTLATWMNCLNIRMAEGVDATALGKQVQQALEKFTPHNDFNVRPLNQAIQKNYTNERRFTKQILLFSLLAVLISIIGVFGLTMFESEYRRKEIGIRKIMGSSVKEILYMFNKRYLYILCGCFAVAAPIGYFLGKSWLQNFALKTAVSPLLFVIAFLLIALITSFTVTYQSWKNAVENPVDSIKTE